MAVTNGLGVRAYVAGYDVSADTNAIDGLGSNQELLDITTLDKSARARLPGLSDAEITLNGFFDNATDMSHDVFTADSGKIPGTDQNVTLTLGTSRGDPACAFAAKESTYNVSRAPGSAMATVVNFSASDGYGLSWGVLLTEGPKQTDTSATNSASVDNGSSTAAGAVAALQVEAFTGTSATVKVQDSSDDAVWSDLLTFTAATGRTSEIVRDTGATTVNRYLRVISTGTFTNLVFVVQVGRL